MNPTRNLLKDRSIDDGSQAPAPQVVPQKRQSPFQNGTTPPGLMPGGKIAQSQPSPAPAQPAQAAARPAREADVANALLNLERDARRAASETELGYLMVNGSRVAVQYRQALLLECRGKKKHRVTAVSSLSAVDRNSTFIRWAEALAKKQLAGEARDKVISFDAHAESADGNLDASTYPFPQVAMVPLKLNDGTVFAHLMLTREAEWDEPSLIAAARLCETYSHAWAALIGPRRARSRLQSRNVWFAMLAIAAVVVGMIPVPLTALAPAEVVAANPYLVTSPIDGVIDEILVEPNTSVQKGTVLYRYNDTDLRNRVELAGQAVRVAESRLTQAMRTSFQDPKAKRELSIMQSELQLKASEYDYAKELLDKAVVRASHSGLVVFADKDTWTGRPVSTGERIMRIADASQVELQVNLPVADAIVLKDKAKLRLFLDSDPLKSIDATLKSASFHAVPDASNALSYRVRATFNADQATPRIGLRGTAQVQGEEVKLAYFLFRKPLAVVRQWLGM